MADGNPFGEIVGRILEGTAPANVRAAAARGALPLPRALIVRLQVHLLGDSDDSIRDAAASQLDGLETQTLQDALSDRDTPAEVLEHFAPRALSDPLLAERIAFHPSVESGTLARLASKGNAQVIDLVLTNEERLLAEPELLEQLAINPALRSDQRGRVLEALRRAGERTEREKKRKDEQSDDDGPEELAGEDLEELARVLEVDVGELLSASEIVDAEEFVDSEDEEIRDAYRKILTLNTAQKAILAMKGNREERMILIRDSNRTVALGVLKNGRITEPEIEAFSRMRNVHAEILRQIGTTREWIKNYAVIHALVTNPRTPQAVSMNFISRLSNRDLKSIGGSRDVPEMIRRMCKRTIETRTQSSRVSFKKK
jgi:hypothetical protein